MIVSDLDDDDPNDDDLIASSHQEGEIHATDGDVFGDDSHPISGILVMKIRTTRTMSVQDVQGKNERRKDLWSLILRAGVTCLCMFKKSGYACESL